MVHFISIKHGLRDRRLSIRTFTVSIIGALLIQSMASAAKPTTSTYETELISSCPRSPKSTRKADWGALFMLMFSQHRQACPTR
jgi:hypothetical protein